MEILETSSQPKYQNVREVKFMVFDIKLSRSSAFYYLEPCLYPSITEIVETLNTVIQERHNQSRICITVKVSRRTQKSQNTLLMKSIFWNCLVKSSDTFLEVLLMMNSCDVEKKRTSQTWFCLRNCPNTRSQHIYRPDWVHYLWQHESSVTALLSLSFRAEQHINYQTFRNL